MPDYINPVLTRDQWQKLRKNPPKWDIPKGAAKVSIGDSIAAVHKPLSLAALDQNIKDSEKLIANLEVYISTIKKTKKYEPFVPSVQSVHKKAGQHLKSMKNIAEKKAAFQKPYNEANYLMAQLFRKNPATKLKDLADKLGQIAPSVQAFALVDDKYRGLDKEAVGWLNKCTVAKALTPDDFAKLGAFLSKIHL